MPGSRSGRVVARYCVSAADPAGVSGAAGEAAGTFLAESVSLVQ